MSGLLWAREGAIESAAKARLWVLDIDGVLLDPTASFYAVAREVAEWAAERALGHHPGEPVTEADIGAFKAVGGWNDDFDLSTGLALALVARSTLAARPALADTARQGAGGLEVLRDWAVRTLPTDVLLDVSVACDRAMMRERCAVRYAGRARAHALYGIDAGPHADLPDDGLWSVETMLCDPALLRDSGRELAFFTGRSPGETLLAAEQLGLAVAADRRVVDDGKVPRKPAPDGLVALAAHAGGEPLLFVGDSVDDQNAALAYRKHAAAAGLPDVVFVRVVGPTATSVGLSEARAAGADIVVTGIDHVVAAATKGARS